MCGFVTLFELCGVLTDQTNNSEKTRSPQRSKTSRVRKEHSFLVSNWIRWFITQKRDSVSDNGELVFFTRLFTRMTFLHPSLRRIPITGKGLAYVVEEKVPAGTLLLSELPLVSVSAKNMANLHSRLAEVFCDQFELIKLLAPENQVKEESFM